MGFQTTINNTLALGIPGEFYDDTPRRCHATAVVSSNALNNVFGRAFTLLTGDPKDGTASSTSAAGGTGLFAGILCNPKQHVAYGTAAGGTLAATMSVPNYTIADLCSMGDLFVQVPAACNIGDQLTFSQADGSISTLPTTVSGITVTQTGNTLTVAGTPSNSNIGVGSVFTIPGFAPSTVTALGTGTGGNGTYTVNTSQTIGSATASTASTVAPSGFTVIPGSAIIRYVPNASGSQIAIAKLSG